MTREISWGAALLRSSAQLDFGYSPEQPSVGSLAAPGSINSFTCFYLVYRLESKFLIAVYLRDGNHHSILLKDEQSALPDNQEPVKFGEKLPESGFIFNLVTWCIVSKRRSWVHKGYQSGRFEASNKQIGRKSLLEIWNNKKCSPQTLASRHAIVQQSNLGLQLLGTVLVPLLRSSCPL
jgi:hypothetical protein